MAFETAWNPADVFNASTPRHPYATLVDTMLGKVLRVSVFLLQRMINFGGLEKDGEVTRERRES